MKKVQFFSVAIILAIIAICGCSNDSEEENTPSIELTEKTAHTILGDDYWDMESIEIPANVTSISDNVFSITRSKTIGFNVIFYTTTSSNIKKITFQNGSRLRNINKSAFYKSKLESIELPEGLEKIGNNAFLQCSLKELKIPNSVTHIDDGAFQECSNLMELEIQGNVAYIGRQAFYSCPKLKKLTLPACIKDATIESKAFHTLDFHNIGNIDEIRYKGTVEDWCKITWSKDAVLWRVNKLYFEDSNTPITSIEIPSTVTSIPPHAFSCNYSLTSVKFSESDIIIGESAFAACDNLSNIEFGSGNTQIGKDAFGSCKKLENIKLSNGIISEDAFSYCENLKYVKLGNGVTSIGDSAFSGCSSLLEVTIPNSVTSIGSNAFIKCTSLKRAIFEVKNQYWQQVSNDGSIDEVGRNFNNEEETAKWLQHGNKKLERL